MGKYIYIKDVNKNSLCRDPREPGSFQAVTSSLQTTEAAKKYQCGWCLGVDGTEMVRTSLFTAVISRRPQCQSLVGWAAGGRKEIGSGQEGSTGSAPSGLLGLDRLQTQTPPCFRANPEQTGGT